MCCRRDDIASYELVLTNNVLNYQKSIKAIPGDSVAFDNLAPGNAYAVNLDAYDDNNKKIFNGQQSDILVEPGRITKAAIQLNYSGGGISVEIIPPDENATLEKEVNVYCYSSVTDIFDASIPFKAGNKIKIIINFMYPVILNLHSGLNIRLYGTYGCSNGRNYIYPIHDVQITGEGAVKGSLTDCAISYVPENGGAGFGCKFSVYSEVDKEPLSKIKVTFMIPMELSYAKLTAIPLYKLYVETAVQDQD